MTRGAFADEGLPVAVLDAWDPAAAWPALDEVAGILALGGSMNVDQVGDFPFLARERGLLRDALGRGIPVFGVCLGAQLVARAMDEPVVPAPTRRIGFLPVSPTLEAAADPVFSLLRPGDLAFHWNEDTCGLPRGGVLMATGEGGSVEAYRAAPAAWATLFHPRSTDPSWRGGFERPGRIWSGCGGGASRSSPRRRGRPWTSTSAGAGSCSGGSAGR